ncbi:MAG: DNA repair protein RadC [Desulfobacterales bacterium]
MMNTNRMSRTPPHKGSGHRQRLRDRFLSSGLNGFHDYEVIELLLTLGTPRRDCKDTAKEVMKRFKTLPEVFEAPVKELCSIDGIGPKNVFGLKLIKAVADRYLKNRLMRSDPISNSQHLFDYLCSSMRDKHQEQFTIIFLDAKNRIISVETLFTGTLTASSVYPREVVDAALRHHAAAVMFAHNHPSGDPRPSSEDVAVTRHLLFACRIMGITAHEHLIVGHNTYYSFSDHGHIAEMNREFERLHGF